MGDSVESVKKLLRSVLLSSKAGVKATRLQGEYQELSGGYIPHDKFGYSSLHDFLATLTDVVQIGKNKDNELTYYAIADSSTQHIQSMVAKQKSVKSKKKPASSFYRNQKKRIFPPKFNANYQRKPRFQNFSIRVTRFNNFSNLKRTVQSDQTAFNPIHRREDKRIVIDSSNTKEDKRIVIRRGSNNLSQSNDNVFKSNVSHMPLRQTNKTKKSVTSNSHDTTLYKNPLGSPETDLHLERSTSIEQSKTNNLANDDKNLKEYDSQFISNMKKLLSVNRNGIQSGNLQVLYKETFKENFPTNLMQSLLSGNMSECVTIERVMINNNEKVIFFPVVQTTLLKTETFKFQSPSASTLYIDHHAPLDIGEEYAVTFTHFESCNKFFIQIVSEAAKLKKMQKLIKNEPKTACANNHKLKPGDYVISSNKRAKVIAVGELVEVYYIDESDSCLSYHIEQHHLYMMPHAIAEYPEFCVCCSMLKPSNQSSAWSVDSNQKFKDLYLDQDIVVKPVNVFEISFKSDDLSHQHSVYCYSGSSLVNLNSKLSADENEYPVWTNDPLKYQPTHFASLPNDEYFDVYVFNASCTTEIDVCVIKEGYSDELVKLEEDMFKHYAKTCLRAPQNPPVDCIYAVLSEESCRRGRLISVENGKGDVYLVDNAEFCRVSLSDLHPLLEQFCHLPLQVITVALAGLEHECLSNHSNVLQKLNDTVVYETCTAHVVGKLQNKSRKVCCVVQLLDTRGPTDININQLCWNVVFDKTLIPAVPDNDCKQDAILCNVDFETDCVFIQLPGKGKEKLDQCMKEYQVYFTMKKFSPSRCAVDLYPGKLCLASLASGIFRVRINEIVESKPRGIMVFLIDVGSYEHVARGMLFKLEEEDCLSLPPQAICCKLSKVQSVEEDQILLKDVSITKNFLPVLIRVDEGPDFQSEDTYFVSIWTKEGTRIVGGKTVCSKMKVTSVHSENLSPDKVSVAVSETSSITDDKQYGDTQVSTNTEMDFKSKQSNITHVNKGDGDSGNASTTKVSDVFSFYLDDNMFPVKVEEVVSPGYLHMLRLEHVAARDVLTTALLRHYGKKTMLKHVTDLKIGLVYALHAPQDNCWYRAKIQSRIENKISVYLIDYGNCYIVNENNLFELDKQFQYISGMVVTAKLCGIQPMGNDKNAWPKTVCEQFRKFVKGNFYYAHVLKISSEAVLQDRNVYHVCLCDTMSTSDVWINDMLVHQWKCATYIK